MVTKPQVSLLTKTVIFDHPSFRGEAVPPPSPEAFYRCNHGKEKSGYVWDPVVIPHNAVSRFIDFGFRYLCRTRKIVAVCHPGVVRTKPS